MMDKPAMDLHRDTVDAWRHYRMYCALDPIIKNFPDAKWLTVGDGRYGKDAQYIRSKGVEVLATDISDSLLKEAREAGYIDQYGKENAESLSFYDGQFDYVLCKESYHHFKRPMVALYEMLRVSKKGVVLIEPNDHAIYGGVLEILFRSVLGITQLICGKKDRRWNDFEKAGNYVYRISEREIEKVAMGLNLKAVAFRGLNDYYIEGVEDEELANDGKVNRKIRRMIKLQNVLAKLKFRRYGILIAVIYQDCPPDEIIMLMENAGFKFHHLPKNPFLKKD